MARARKRKGRRGDSFHAQANRRSFVPGRPLGIESLESRCLLAADALGANDFIIGHVGPDFSDLGFALNSVVAYNFHDHEYLVVWEGHDGNPDSDIFGQRVDAATGQPVGGRIQISDMGPPGSTSFAAREPAVVYNHISHEYLVVWEGTDDRGGVVPFEFEIYGQRLTAAGQQIGADDFRISDAGNSGTALFEATGPAVAFNDLANEYLVVWRADDSSGELVDDEFEIFGERLNAAGQRVGQNDFRISDMGPDGDTAFGVSFDPPSVVFNRAAQEYLVVWAGDDTVNGEQEIFGQRLSAEEVEVGVNDFRISDMGPDGNTNFFARQPQVAFNPLANEYLVVWTGSDGTEPADLELEIFGQRLSAAGVEIGVNDFRISDMGTEGGVNFGAFEPEAAFNPISNEYLVTWSGDDDTGLLVDGEFEIFGQLLAADGAEIGVNDFRISDMGSDGDTRFTAFTPDVVFNGDTQEYFVVWTGLEDANGLEDPDVFGQRLGLAPLLAVGADAGGGPHVRVFQSPGLEPKFSFFAYDPTFTGGVRVATGDVTGDGVPDIVTAPGPGLGPLVRVFDGTTGDPVAGTLGGFFAYAPAFGGGVYIALADLDADGHADIITGPGTGGGPHVRVFSGATGELLGGGASDFFAYHEAFTGGVRVATGDVNGDGALDIITGAGPGGGPHVRAFSSVDGAELASFFAFDPTYTGGVFVASGNAESAPGSDADEIVVGEGLNGSRARVFSAGGVLLTEVNTFPAGEVRVALSDINTDGRADLILGHGATPGIPSRVQVIDLTTSLPIESFLSHGPFAGGNFVAGMSLPPGGSPLRADGGEAAVTTDVAPLTIGELMPVVAQAVAFWQESAPGLVGGGKLRGIDFRIADLPGGLLGLTLGQTIYIDQTAAGHGWQAAADAEGRPYRMDLATTVAHELGHALGLDDLDYHLHADELMADVLAAGQRRLPDRPLLADAVFSDWT